MYMYEIPLLTPELKWMLLGEQTNMGKLLYVDILDDIAPLSAFVYGLIDKLFGRSILAYKVIALIITAFQIIYFTNIVHKKGLFLERNYVPGLIFLIFFSVSPDLATLSPALMGNTLLLIAFGAVINQVERLGIMDNVFEIGVFISISAMFYPPLCIFIVWAMFVLSLYSGFKIRQQFLLIFGYIFPVGLVGLRYFIIGHYDDFYENFIGAIFNIRQFNLNDFKGLASTMTIPFIFSVLGFFVALGTSKYKNNQTRAQKIILLWFLIAFLSIGLMPYLSPMQFIPFLLPFTFYTTVFFESYNRRKLVPELIFISLFIFILYVNYQSFMPNLSKFSFAKSSELLVDKKEINTEVFNKKLLVLGNNLSPYLNNLPATPYVNWAMAKNEFGDLNNYESVIKILSNFEKDAPQYIIDQQNIMPKIFGRIPTLAKRYKTQKAGMYVLIE